jgi:hypothetical protein
MHYEGGVQFVIISSEQFKQETPERAKIEEIATDSQLDMELEDELKELNNTDMIINGNNEKLQNGNTTS